MAYPPVHRQLPPVPPPAGGSVLPAARVEPIPGTPFALAYLSVPRPTSGTAIGSLVAGIASLLVTCLVGCFGWLGAQQGVGALVGGAFAVLGTALGAAAMGLGIVGRRQQRRTAAGGRGMALAGIVCGASSIGLILITMVALLLV